MAFEALRTELMMMIQGLEDQPENFHELYLQVREKLNEMKAMGLPMPDDLVRLETELEERFQKEQKG
ncbi:MAG: hypothetical protein ACWA5T_09900 [Parvularcula sp.]